MTDYKTLAEVREHIDRVDKGIKDLFVERMELADNVARIKAATGDSIYKPDRETLIIGNQSQDMKPELMKEYRALLKRVMEVSRKYQYGRTLELLDCFPEELEAAVSCREIRISFILSDRCGALATILTMIADYGVNVTDIHSEPVDDTSERQIKFFLTLHHDLPEQELRALLFQLYSETASFQLC